MSAWESTRTPSLRKSASCSIIALRNSSESPILSSSATVHPPSVDWSLLKEPHGGRLRQQPLPFTHLRGHYPLPWQNSQAPRRTPVRSRWVGSASEPLRYWDARRHKGRSTRIAGGPQPAVSLLWDSIPCG